MSIAHTIQVELGIRSYPIVIGSGLLDGDYDIGTHLSGSDCLVVSNETVAPLYLDRLVGALGDKTVASMNLPDGEAYKTTDTLHTILDRLADIGASRDSTVIALGGGVVGDIAGYAAASYMRGIGFIQVPTTLLAQVDSSVGGKTGINLPQGKNLVGAFYQPGLVLIDVATLETLPARELSAGLAEVIKYGAIVDAEFFAWLEDNMDALLAGEEAALVHAIRRSCELKAQVVAEDERESGRRGILNFGHTFGHAIEHSQGYGDWLHGEAVAAGMIMAAKLSGIEAGEIARLTALIERAGLPTAPPKVGAATLRNAMNLDKKVQDKRLRFVLLQALGDAVVTAEFNEDGLQQVLEAAD